MSEVSPEDWGLLEPLHSYVNLTTADGLRGYRMTEDGLKWDLSSCTVFMWGYNVTMAEFEAHAIEVLQWPTGSRDAAQRDRDPLDRVMGIRVEEAFAKPKAVGFLVGLSTNSTGTFLTYEQNDDDESVLFSVTGCRCIDKRCHKELRKPGFESVCRVTREACDVGPADVRRLMASISMHVWRASSSRCSQTTAVGVCRNAASAYHPCPCATSIQGRTVPISRQGMPIVWSAVTASQSSSWCRRPSVRG
mmetsp:Transcript_26992/g.67199  ORF Transcript_26992/g.67199 Transcript_26992/m.67199 type:complete len:248 (-) Transcript_26992:2631-3374(-)